jgi:hypothetical protein
MGNISELESEDCTPSKPQKVENVGETFMEWAEKYWALRTTITAGATHGQGESCPYDYMRAAFVEKINKLNELNKIE